MLAETAASIIILGYGYSNFFINLGNCLCDNTIL